MSSANQTDKTRIALLIEYSGKKFHGSQYQEGVLTVQQELERALSILARQPIRATLSGRTDTGVSARGQVVHVDWPTLNKEQKEAPLTEAEIFDLIWRINGIVVPELSVTEIVNVPNNFHARFSAFQREYVYRILNRPQRSALLKDTHHFVREPLNICLLYTSPSPRD